MITSLNKLEYVDSFEGESTSQDLYLREKGQHRQFRMSIHCSSGIWTRSLSVKPAEGSMQFNLQDHS
jgi:hypothetical protein